MEEIIIKTWKNNCFKKAVNLKLLENILKDPKLLVKYIKIRLFFCINYSDKHLKS